MVESEEELKGHLMKMKESERAGLKLNIQITKIMASGPISSWQIDGQKKETVINSDRLIFMGSKITADCDCSHEIKRHSLLGRKTTTNIECIRRQGHHFADKGPCSHSYGFSSSRVLV